jgi:glycosyltransferase involved in cell wall biosynthesis
MVVIKWEGPLTDPVGYATVAREFLLALDKIGVECHLPWGIQGWTNLRSLDKEFLKLFNKINKRTRKHGLTIHFRLPYPQKMDRYGIIMTLFETTRIPKAWTRHCNIGFKETWIPNNFNMKAFARSGVKRLHKIRYGVNIERYNTKVKDLELEDSFKFFSTFDFSYRKNPHGLLEAYFKTFDYGDPVVLYVKTWNIPTKQFANYMNKIKAGMHKKLTPKVILIPNIVTDNKMAQLYKSVDCLIMPSYGEGWSMPCSQSMACGTPVIATNWGGQLEFMDSRNSFLIGVDKMVMPRILPHLPYTTYMKWAQPKINHLCVLMRYVYEHQKEARSKGLRAHRDIQAFKWENAAKTMEKRAERIV